MADYYGCQIIPHVSGNAARFPLGMAATLHAMASVDNCPMVEYPYDPPILTPAHNQVFVHEQILVEADGCVQVPDKPGLGITLRQDKLA